MDELAGVRPNRLERFGTPERFGDGARRARAREGPSPSHPLRQIIGVFGESPFLLSLQVALQVALRSSYTGNAASCTVYKRTQLVAMMQTMNFEMPDCSHSHRQGLRERIFRHCRVADGSRAAHKRNPCVLSNLLKIPSVFLQSRGNGSSRLTPHFGHPHGCRLSMVAAFVIKPVPHRGQRNPRMNNAVAPAPNIHKVKARHA